MNCDQAFDRMTDVTTLSDAALERHLTDCPRCRQMRETLSPALDAFSVAAAGSRSLREDAQAVQVARQAAVTLESRGAGSARRRRTKWKWGAVSLVAGGVAAALLLAIGGFAPSNDVGDRAAAGDHGDNVAACTWVQNDRGSERDARTVVLSCVACHLAESPQ